MCLNSHGITLIKEIYIGMIIDNFANKDSSYQVQNVFGNLFQTHNHHLLEATVMTHNKIYFNILILFILTLSTSFTSMNIAAQNKATITAWGHIEVEGPSETGDFGIEMDRSIITLRLSALDGSYYNEIKVNGGNFEFESVPTNVKLQFFLIPSEQINYNNNKEYSAVYEFHKPSLLGGLRGKKAAGYIGDFKIIFPSGKIIYNNRYIPTNN